MIVSHHRSDSGVMGVSRTWTRFFSYGAQRAVITARTSISAATLCWPSDAPVAHTTGALMSGASRRPCRAS